jgi:hypothetical protein
MIGSNMQRRRRAIEADVAGDRRRVRQAIERLGLGDLMDESSRGEHVEEVGFIGLHRDHCLSTILSENRFPLFGIMRLAMLAAAPLV